MPVYYSRVPADTPEEQRRLVLEVEEYRKKSAEGTLTRREKFFGFKIEVSQSYGILRFGSEDRFLQRYSEGFLDFEDLAHPGRTLTYPVELLRHPPSGPTRGGTAANHTMAARPTVQVSGLSPLCEHGSSATISPARGKEMRASLLQKLRPPPLVHSWDFWHDRQDRQPISQTGAEDKTEELRYEDRLVKLCEISDVKQFWEMWNNFDTTSLPMKDGVHLFKRGVKPVWEDPRNVKGGSWTFRVPKEKAKEFWKEICLLAIGEQLGEAVATNLKSKVSCPTSHKLSC